MKSRSPSPQSSAPQAGAWGQIQAGVPLDWCPTAGFDAIRLRDAREAARLMLTHLARIETQLEFTPPAADTPDLAQLLGA